jgi:hypothetical protein
MSSPFKNAKTPAQLWYLHDQRQKKIIDQMKMKDSKFIFPRPQQQNSTMTHPESIKHYQKMIFGFLRCGKITEVRELLVEKSKEEQKRLILANTLDAKERFLDLLDEDTKYIEGSFFPDVISLRQIWELFLEFGLFDSENIDEDFITNLKIDILKKSGYEDLKPTLDSIIKLKS